MSRYVGVVLAGGQGRRLGRTKGDLEVDGTALADRAAAVLWPLCATVLISTGDQQENPAPRYESVLDAPPAGRGPLAGIEAAFVASGHADLFVLACDYPKVPSSLVRQIMTFASDTDDDLVIPTDSRGRDHPLVGVWKRGAVPAVHDALGTGSYRVRGLLPDLKVRRLGPGTFPDLDLCDVLLNVNWPADLEKIGG